MIGFSERWSAVGASLSGKSTLAVGLTLTAPGPRLLLDPGASDVCDVPGAVTVTDVRRLAPHDVCRFVPSDPFDLDVWNEAYRWALSFCAGGGHLMVLCDEAETVMPVHGCPPAARQAVYRGAKLRLGHGACMTRPRGIDGSLLANAAHLFVFDLPQRHDREHVAGYSFVAAEELHRLICALPERGFLWIDRTRRTVTPCDPLPTPHSWSTSPTAPSAERSASPTLSAAETSSSPGSANTCGSASDDAPGPA